jgi:hypothetical protein
MEKFETEWERIAREQREAKEALMKVFLETRLGKFMLSVLDWLSRLLKG